MEREIVLNIDLSNQSAKTRNMGADCTAIIIPIGKELGPLFGLVLKSEIGTQKMIFHPFVFKINGPNLGEFSVNVFSENKNFKSFRFATNPLFQQLFALYHQNQTQWLDLCDENIRDFITQNFGGKLKIDACENEYISSIDIN